MVLEGIKKRMIGAIMLVMVLALTAIPSGVSVVYANELEDNVSGGSSSGDSGLFSGDISKDDQAVSDWISDQRGMTGEQLNVAEKTLTPVTNIIGYIVGGVFVLTVVFIFLMTAVDLLYIAFPPIRPLLFPGGSQQGGMGMGGAPMAGGYGGYGRGGYGGMGMSGMAQGGTGKVGHQWISDEAVQCAALMGGAQTQQGSPMMGGMGMGMGMMGGQQQEPMSTKSVIMTYFKKRLVFMILFAIAAIVLTSSALLGTGVNLASWLLKIIGMF